MSTRNRLALRGSCLPPAGLRLAFVTLMVAACSAGPGPTPMIIYVTPIPSATPTPTPAPTHTPNPTLSPTPSPAAYRFIPATNGKGSGLHVVSQAAVSWGSFSGMDGLTARFVVKVKNTTSQVLEMQHGFPNDNLAHESRVILHFSDGRGPQEESAEPLRSRIGARATDYVVSGWAWQQADFDAVQSVEVIVYTRRPVYDVEAWHVEISSFTTSGATIMMNGTLTNSYATGSYMPLINAVLLDAADRPISYSVASLPSGTDLAIGDMADWTINEALPFGIAADAAKTEVTPSSALDQWGTAGDVAREIQSLSP